MANFYNQMAPALSEFAKQLQQKQLMDEQNQLATAYAGNPAYAQAKFGLQNQAMLQAQQERELAKQDALRKFAASFSEGITPTGGIVPTGINPSGQAELNAKLGGGKSGGVNDALVKYAQITGDPSLLIKQQMDQENARTGLNSPAAIKQVQWYMQATPEERSLYDRVNKVGVEKIDAGDAWLFVDKNTGQQVSRVPKNLAPNETLDYKGDVKTAEVLGTNTGEAQAEYSDLSAAYPQLIDTTDRLARLAQVATYTKTGQWNDSIKRQLGVNVGNAAEAAAEMATIIDVEVLPLLKPTFGAAFTVNEGEWLRNTMGNPGLSPEEKTKQIEARVRGWNNRIKTLENRLGVEDQDKLNIVEPNINLRNTQSSGTINALDFLNE